MKNQVAVTRLLLIAFPIAFIAKHFGLGAYVSLPIFIVGIIVLIARRRSLPDAIVGSRRGQWWAWTLGGLAMIGTGIGLSFIYDSEDGGLGWVLFSLFVMAGTLIIAASFIRGLVLMLRRPSTPA